MRQIVALAWKEWREVRWVLAVAAVLFVALPLIGGLEGLWTWHQFGFAPHFLIIWCGGILGTLAGAFAAARDLNGPVAEFIHSRAIGVAPREIVKYAVGLITLWIACLVPLAIEIWTDRRDRLWSDALERQAIWLMLTWAAQYSLGFVCGSLTRRTGPAVMLAFGLTLLAYFLPLILPPLQAYSVSEVLEHGQTSRIPFLIAAITITLTSLAVAILFVRMDWRVRAGQGLMYWSIAVVLLLLFTSASFQVASNLPVLQEISLDPGESVMSIDSDGHRGALVTWVIRPPKKQTAMIRSIDVTPSGVRLGDRIPIPWLDFHKLSSSTGTVWLSAHPDVCFTIREKREAGPKRIELDVVSLHPTKDANPVATLDLGAGYEPSDATFLYFQVSTSVLHGVGNELLAAWQGASNHLQVAVIDVSDPVHPQRILADLPLWPGVVPIGSYSQWFDCPQLGLGLPPLPGASDQERLQLAARMSIGRSAALANGTLVLVAEGRLLLYRLARLSDAHAAIPRGGDKPPFELPHGLAEFQRAGSRDFSILEKFLHTDYGSEQIAAIDGRAYLSMQAKSFGRPLSRVTVLDISNPSRPRPVGHFAAPDKEAFAVQPLPDGRALIGGRKLYLVGPPPTRAGS